MSSNYSPPYVITPEILNLVSEICEWVGRFSASGKDRFTPRLRRGNRIKTIQSSLAIENNSLTLEQVTAVLQGKRVMGLPMEIQEVRNAFSAYESMENWTSTRLKDLLEAHSKLMSGLVDRPGRLRNGGVGIYQGKKLVHMAPPADRLPQLMRNLLRWLKTAPDHRLITSCVFHYEFEFIHPFADGNGRLGRLWQTLILSEWKPLWAYLPVETIIRERQTEYYLVLKEADLQANSTPFITFMLTALRDSIVEAMNQGAEDSGAKSALSRRQVRILEYCREERPITELMALLDRGDRTKFRNALIRPLLAAGYLELTIPDKPNSSNQKYILTRKGREVLDAMLTSEDR